MYHNLIIKAGIYNYVSLTIDRYIDKLIFDDINIVVNKNKSGRSNLKAYSYLVFKLYTI